jgi:hypothetical protein
VNRENVTPTTPVSGLPVVSYNTPPKRINGGTMALLDDSCCAVAKVGQEKTAIAKIPHWTIRFTLYLHLTLGFSHPGASEPA